MPREPTGDPVLEAEIERAMRPYRSLLPPDMQDVFEDILVMAYTEHPVGRAILARLRPQRVTSESGPRAILDDAGPAEAARPDAASQGGDERSGKSSSGAPRRRGPGR